VREIDFLGGQIVFNEINFSRFCPLKAIPKALISIGIKLSLRRIKDIPLVIATLSEGPISVLSLSKPLFYISGNACRYPKNIKKQEAWLKAF